MKHKFSSMGRVAIALVLALSLSLVMTVPVSADVEGVVVVPTDRTAAATDIYTITMTTTEALTGGTDTISIVFPEEITVPALVAVATDVKINAQVLDAADDYVVSGQRLSLTVPTALGAVAAGTVIVEIGLVTTQITNPDAGSYTMDVYTSQEPTAVTSEEFVIGGSADSQLAVVSVALVECEVGLASQYTIQITTEGTTLAANIDTITITFPDGTIVPSSIASASYVTIGVNELDATTDYSADGQEVTLTVPAGVGAGTHDVVFTVDAGIINPTIVDADPITGGDDKYSLTAHTSQEPIESDATDYTALLDPGDGCLIELTAPESFDLTPNVGETFTVQTTDEFGNPTTDDDTGTILFETSSATGAFTPVTDTLSSGVASSSHTDTVSGTYTITIQAVPLTTYTNIITQEIVVNPSVALLHDGVEVASFDTIELAIDAAVVGDTIQVGPGTYAESGLTIGIANLTLESTGTAAETIIDVDGEPNGIVINAAGVTVDGFTIKDAGTVAIQTSALGTIIQNNVITQEDPWKMGINLGAGVAEVTVSGNELDINSTMYVSSGASDITLINNTFGAGINLEEDISEITITDNTIIGAEFEGICFDDKDNSGTYDDILIEGNTISQTTEGDAVGIYVRGTTVTTLQIIYNDISDNEGPGIVIPDGVTLTDPVIMYNDISGNGGYGIEGTVTAQYNWWGSSTGPEATDNPSGAGDAVSAGVNYGPWLADDQATVVASGKSQYAMSITLNNVATLSDSTYSGGWNTFSTPIWLHGDGDTWGEITDLVTLDYVTAYGWDGTTWTTVGASTPLTPLDAIFVQLKTGAQSLPILFSTQLLPAPTKDMSAGWELVGLAALTETGEMVTETALASIATKYSQAIDPITGEVVTTQNLTLGRGYWVFVTIDGTLAGFSVTPQPFVSVQ